MVLYQDVDENGIVQDMRLQVLELYDILFDWHHLNKWKLGIGFVIGGFPLAAMASLGVNSYFDFDVFYVFPVFCLCLEFYLVQLDVPGALDLVATRNGER